MGDRTCPKCHENPSYLCRTCARKLREALREAMRYVESTDGTRGDLMGCQVNAHEFLAWVRLAGDLT